MPNTYRSSWPRNAVSHLQTSTAGAELELPALILDYARSQPEGTPLLPETFGHLGSSEAVRRAMSDLAEQGNLNRVYDNTYVKPVQTRFGSYSPAFEEVIPKLADLWKETIVPSGGASANALGMTTQVPVKPVYLTSGHNKILWFGNLAVHLRHAPGWQLVAPDHMAGDIIRALAWMGPEEVEEGLEFVQQSMSIEALKALTEDSSTTPNSTIPKWITEPINAMTSNA
jgi:hypothetical protein